MNAEHATPEVIDALARIEIERREKEKESGVPVSCNWALGKLYELLPGERKSPGTNAGTALQANIEATTLAIGRLRELARTTGQRATPKGERPWHQQKSWRDAQKKSFANRPQRAMNRQES
ncbi:MAG TPA: hypothetical protein VKD03_01440 [Burkholderiales bacterium]|nr:hypothetical protein [Burkholderiales bacterium]